jgi:hypothetical protein
VVLHARKTQNVLNPKSAKTNSETTIMTKDNVLIAITASREKEEIVYRVDCSSSLTNEEFEYYLEEIIKGICKWKPTICERNIRSFKGTINTKKK